MSTMADAIKVLLAIPTTLGVAVSTAAVARGATVIENILLLIKRLLAQTIGFSRPFRIIIVIIQIVQWSSSWRSD